MELLHEKHLQNVFVRYFQLLLKRKGRNKMPNRSPWNWLGLSKFNMFQKTHHLQLGKCHRPINLQLLDGKSFLTIFKTLNSYFETETVWQTLVGQILCNLWSNFELRATKRRTLTWRDLISDMTLLVTIRRSALMIKPLITTQKTIFQNASLLSRNGLKTIAGQQRTMSSVQPQFTSDFMFRQVSINHNNVRYSEHAMP